MTEEKLEQATAYLSGVRGAEAALNKLGKYKPHAALFGIRIGDEHIYIENELAEQIISLPQTTSRKRNQNANKNSMHYEQSREIIQGLRGGDPRTLRVERGHQCVAD